MGIAKFRKVYAKPGDSRFVVGIGYTCGGPLLHATPDYPPKKECRKVKSDE
jgi:hypothetical protein